MSKVLEINVAGTSFENRQSLLGKMLGNEPCRLVPELNNQYDPNAIAVHVGFEGGVFHIGYIPREWAKRIAPLLEGEALDCRSWYRVGGFELASGETAFLGAWVVIEVPDTMDISDSLPF